MLECRTMMFCAIILVTVMWVVLRWWRHDTNTSKHACDVCGEPYIYMGRSKCYDCDRSLANMRCHKCHPAPDSYLSRLEVAKPGAVLGRP
jgi:hypothetical protein